ncbi:hypothetical protein EW145_g2929 [Phellinidium pouzarii]|uniref:Reverse transcriptase n=1 Tax=Phellinidium pouzarii TaxID=167371 RepID=A0A4S4L9H7_9AGAM|nr:hypothetical protein EW145_g2929 [Phellinidium pouzarii]
MDKNFALFHDIPTQTLKNPIKIYNVDGTPNVTGTITHYTWQYIDIQGTTIPTRFLLSTLGREDIIFGLPWLQKVNPTIDWNKGTLAFEHAPKLIISNLTCQEFLIQSKTTTATTLKQQKVTPQATLTLEQHIPKEYHDFLPLFDKQAASQFPPERNCDHAINLKPDFISKRAKVYQMSPQEREELDWFIDENLAKGYIRPSMSPQASPFFFVGKKDGTYRGCQDYHYLNEGTIKNAYPLPLISDLLDKLKGMKYFTKLDVRSGYNNICIKDGDQEKAAFITPRGLFEPTVMFFGLCNSPATFQKFMDEIYTKEIIAGAILIYMDDVLIFATTKSILHDKTIKVLTKMRDNDLYLKPEKCAFCVEKVEYLGLIISQDQIAMDPSKLTGVSHWPTPTKLKEVQQFLGFTNYYRRFINNYTSIAQPLDELKMKGIEWEWTPEREQAFQRLKSKFLEQPILTMPNFTKPFILETDASQKATGAVLHQYDANGNLKPCGYVSQALDSTQQRYEIYDRELLAIICGIKAWQHYLLGSPHKVTVWCDHKNLTYFCHSQHLNMRQARWHTMLQEYDLHITHKPGKTMIISDSMSRHPDYFDGEEEKITETVLPQELFIKALTMNLHTQIVNATKDDLLAQNIIKALMDKSIPPIRSVLSDWKQDQGLLLFKEQTYLPEDASLRREIVRRHHDPPVMGHPGIYKTIVLVRKHYWWPGLSAFVKQFIDGCTLCQQMKVNTHPLTPPLKPIEADKHAYPFLVVSMDFITDLPESQGFDSLFVIVDHILSKGIVLIPYNKTVDAVQMATLYFDNVYRWFGLPTKIISDRGPQFASQVFIPTHV